MAITMKDKQEDFLQEFEKVRLALGRFTRALTRDGELAKDLMSETVLQAYEGFDRLRDRSSFKSWIFTIAARLDKKRYRRLKFTGAFNQDDADALQDRGRMPDVEPDVRLLYEAIDKLPAKQKEAILLFEISELTIEEIAKVQHGTLSGVKSRLRRARERLSELLLEPKKKPTDSKIILDENAKIIIEENAPQYSGGYRNEK